MAVIRNTSEVNNSVDYLSSVAIFGCVSLLVMMLKFLGFKASLNFNGRGHNINDYGATVSMVGAYRTNRDEFYDNVKTLESPKVTSSSMVKLKKGAETNPTLKQHKSTSDLTKQNNLSANLSRSSQNVSYDPRGATSSETNKNTATVIDERKNVNKNNKEQTKLEKKRLTEQKAREKAEAQERAQQDKLKKEKEKQSARERARERDKQSAKRQVKAKNVAPPAPAPQLAPQSQNNTKVTKPAPAAPAYSTNTMQSSISTSSGPPPYSEEPNLMQGTVSRNTPNVIFGKPIDQTNSWDLISQHRQEMSKSASQGPSRIEKNMVMDLQYK